MNRIATLTLTAIAVFFLYAQSAAQVYYDFTQSSGTYTAITGGTVLRSGTFDLGVPQTVALPTSFTFSGNPYSSCNVSIEGWLSIGGTNPGSGEVTPISTSSGASGFIAPFGADLANSSAIGSTPEMRWQQVSNEIIFQWQDVRRSGSAITERFSFQARLNTVSGEIRLVYGPTAAIDNANTNNPQVGLRGATNSVFLNRLVTSNWATSTAGGVNSATCQFSPSVVPASGLTYIWRPVPAGDVGVISVTGVSQNLLLPTGGAVTINATVRNFTAAAQELIHVYYSVNGAAQVGPVSTTGSLAQNTNQVVSFTGGNAWTPTVAGTYTIKIFTDIVSEQVRSNDTIAVTNVIVQTPIAAFPYYEQFTSATGWTTSGTALWGRVSGTGPDGAAGDALAKADFHSISTNNQMYYRSPLLNLPSTLSAGGGWVLMHFHVAHRDYDAAGFDDTLQVVVSTNGGATWSAPLYDKRSDGTPSLATIVPSTTAYTPSAASDWRHETVDLSFYAGQQNICVAFLGRSGWGNNCYIDNVSIVTTSDYGAAAVAALGAVNMSGITFNFTAGTQFPGTLHAARFSGGPPTIASVPFAPNTTALPPFGSAFTPNIVSNDRWWTVTYSADAVARNTYSVSIDLTTVSNIGNASRLYVVTRADMSASWVARTTTLAGSILTASGLTGFSDFGIAGNSAENPLPIQLGSFTGTALNATSVRLNWMTVSEVNNFGFYVERRAGTQGQFVEVFGSFVAGHGTTNEPHSYTFTDNTVPAAGSYQYRLRQVDLDGTENRTEPINVTTGVTSVNGNKPAPREFALFQNYPNPFNPSTQIKFDLPENSNVSLVVYDVLGRKIAELENGMKEAGYHSATWNASEVASGVYFARFTAMDANGTVKLSKVNKLLLTK